MTRTRTRPFAFLLAAIATAGCGDNPSGEIPPALLDAIRNSETSGTYPGPYGSEEGDIAANVCFEAWMNPRASAFDASQMQTMCLADFYDPEAADHRLLIVNTAATWCTACRAEYGRFEDEGADNEIHVRAPGGLRYLGVIFQDARREPATADDATLWADTYDVGFPFGLDADFAMGRFASSTIQPFNMVIDTRTMTIEKVVEGDFPEVLWPFVDALLESP